MISFCGSRLRFIFRRGSLHPPSLQFVISLRLNLRPVGPSAGLDGRSVGATSGGAAMLLRFLYRRPRHVRGCRNQRRGIGLVGIESHRRRLRVEIDLHTSHALHLFEHLPDRDWAERQVMLFTSRVMVSGAPASAASGDRASAEVSISSCG
jgi:hypothetical protein